MENIYMEYLAKMNPDDVSFIVSDMERFVNDNPINCFPETLSEEDEESRRRRHIEREWPAIGTILTADYYGTRYTAEIVPATKRLKSGRQIRIGSGPAETMLCDSFSEAMIAATEEQRSQQNLARKGVSNGWLFWNWDGKPENISSDED